jgi:hypothetical protein
VLKSTVDRNKSCRNFYEKHRYRNKGQIRISIIHTETRFLSPLSTVLTGCVFTIDVDICDDRLPFVFVVTSARRFCCHT